jgi:signal transduction histidine kinase
MVVTPEEVAIYTALGRHYGAFQHIHGRMRALAGQGRWEEARALNATESLQAELAFRQAGSRFLELNLAAADRAQLAEETALLRSEVLAVSLALAGALLAGFLWRRAAREIVGPLEALRHGVAEVAAGRDVGPPHPAARKTAELAELEGEVHRMAGELAATTAALRAANTGLEAEVDERTAALREANARLEGVVEELRSVDRLKSDFVAVTSHELLTPIAFIVGFASALEDGLMGPLVPEQADAVKKIQEGADRLTRMVRNTLEYSQAAAGDLSVHLEPVDLGEVVGVATEAVAARAAEAGLGLGVAIAPGLPAAWADPDRVGQVVGELLDNAIKFTPRGGRIHVVVRAAGEGLVCEVADTGPGIPPDAAERLYQPFYQADGSRTRAHGGLGLGLALSRHLARRMAGDLEVRSRAGQGATFRLRLTRAADAEDAPAPAAVRSWQA